MAYTTGSTFSLQTGYNIPTFIYPANGMTSSTRTNGVISSGDPYTATINSSFLTDISNMTITAEQLALIAENEPLLLLNIQTNQPITRTKSTDTIGQMIINKILLGNLTGMSKLVLKNKQFHGNILGHDTWLGHMQQMQK